MDQDWRTRDMLLEKPRKLMVVYALTPACSQHEGVVLGEIPGVATIQRIGIVYGAQNGQDDALKWFADKGVGVFAR